MKKRLITIVSLILSALVMLTSLTACDLVTTNSERDMEQIVATVNIGGDYKGKTENIYKKDMVIAYMQYGYYYAQQGSYSSSQLFGAIIDNLVNDRILIQTAKGAIAKKENLTLKTEDWDDAGNFLKGENDSKKQYEAEYLAVNSMKSLINGLKEEKETYQDTLDQESRNVPTGATNYVEKVDYSKETVDSLKKSLKDDEIGSKQNVAYNKAIRLLQVNNLIEENETDILNSYYYKNVLNSAFESLVIQKYEQLLLDNEIEKDFNKLTYEALENIFNEMYNNQKKLYENDESAYKTALGSATKTAPIVYNEKYSENYGYVWNLLIGATDEQTEEIGKIDVKTDKEKRTERKEILDDDIVLKDQRSSWVTSGYDAIFEEDLNTTGEGSLRFVNDYSFLEDGLHFKGKVKWLNKGDYIQKAEKNDDGKWVIKYYNGESTETDEEYVPELRVVSLNEVKGIGEISDKLSYFVGLLSGTTNDIVNELMFAFSTDPGSLNSFNGYVIKNEDASSTYVTEFQKAGEDLLFNTEKQYSDFYKDVMGYYLVPTDYGYHVMISNGKVKDYKTLEDYCTAVDGSDFATESYFNKLKTNWVDLSDDDKDTYMYYLANTYLSSIVSDYETEFERLARTDSKKVQRFESRYEDLLGA